MPITQKAIRLAWQFASEHKHPQKVEQIYINTLAVLVVCDYLKLLDIETDLSQCDSWNPVIRLFENVADLYIKGLGKIECIPIRRVHQNTQNGNAVSAANLPETCPIHTEARDERIGYIAVEIDEEEKQARLLGFSPTAATGELVLSDLYSLDDFLIHLEKIHESKVDLRQWLENKFTANWLSVESIFDPQPETEPTEIENPIKSNLGNWLQNVAEAGWQKFEQGKQNLEDLIFPEDNPSFVFRGGGNSTTESGARISSNINRFPEADVTRAKLIDLGMRLGSTTVALLVAIAQEDDRTFRVHVQLHPAIGDRYLPRHLKLSLISDAGEILQELESTVQHQCISLEFYVEPGECFGIRLAIDDLSITENFMV
ncbi:DUF1822 family protein [Microcoleus sp. LEGE 07076]|uniref:DUF1822 family protein n=1 Tax=Microcoleus sp. LEGE 07076 TaxID=915322 RepID=UPI00187F1242|nr:DUF1822 family protein [Microcoleus sp. LEGE 07076]